MNSFVKNNSLLIGRRKSIVSPVGYNSANYLNTANWNGTTTGNVTSVGTNGGPSAYGTYDQTGNVNEWNDKIYIVSGLSTRGLWGGSYATTAINLISTRRNFQPQSSNGSSDIGFRLASINDPLNYTSGNNQFLTVGDPNNTNYFDGTIGSMGTVEYSYMIMKYPVTNAEYVIFLNSIAKTDTNTVYNINMNNTAFGGIARTGTSGNFTYTLKSNFGNKPVNFISWYRAARFANWLSNGRPSGSQNSSTTENGAYQLSGNTGVPVLNSINPNTGVAPTYRLPTENEWWKAAYYKGNGLNSGYWNYATQSNDLPNRIAATILGDGAYLSYL